MNTIQKQVNALTPALPTATTSTSIKGGVMVGDNINVVASTGKISVPKATNDIFGVVKAQVRYCQYSRNRFPCKFSDPGTRCDW